MLSIPLIGGPHDGLEVVTACTTAELYLPIGGPKDLPSPFYVPFLQDKFGRPNLYRLSPCGRRYLHESIVGER